ncbi:MAG: HD domain-containing protein [Solirubrobacteraceae bacterium]|nr:HD domain-containing protein [Solirubrobacteraceae bacterium]
MIVPVTQLSPRFHDALAYAAAHFQGRSRPNTRVPGIAHAMAVAALVIDLADDEDEAIAALLHDVVEDGGGLAALKEIEERWGSVVSGLVAECSDELEPTDRTWRQRKAADLATYPVKSAGALRIALADKTDNTHTLLRALQTEGDALFARHAAGDRATFLWYYEALASALAARADELGPGGRALLCEFRNTVAQLSAFAAPLAR